MDVGHIVTSSIFSRSNDSGLIASGGGDDAIKIFKEVRKVFLK